MCPGWRYQNTIGHPLGEQFFSQDVPGKPVCRYTDGADCHVSKTMLVRFAQKLGFSGYSAMKAQIKLDLQERTSDTCGLLNHITSSYNKMMDDLLKKDMIRFFSLLEHSQRVFVFGSGSSQAMVAGEMKRIFLPVREMIHLQGHDVCHALYEIATPQDIIIYPFSELCTH